jgi:hypothetical protein
MPLISNISPKILVENNIVEIGADMAITPNARVNNPLIVRIHQFFKITFIIIFS